MKSLFTKKERELIKFRGDFRRYPEWRPIVVFTMRNNYGTSYTLYRTVRSVKLMVKLNPSFFSNVVYSEVYPLL